MSFWRTPNIRPSKVLKGSGDSISGTRTEDIGVTDLEEAISKCFIGIRLNMHDTSYYY